jgi:hypothetical protein
MPVIPAMREADLGSPSGPRQKGNPNLKNYLKKKTCRGCGSSGSPGTIHIPSTTKKENKTKNKILWKVNTL